MICRRRNVIIGIILFVLFCLLCCTCAIASTLQIPNDVEEISEEAFSGDTSLDQVVLPENIERIGSRAFANSSVKRIYLPESLKSIAYDAFDGCEGVIGWGTDYTYASVFCDNCPNIIFERPEGSLDWQIPEVSAKQCDPNTVRIYILDEENQADEYVIGEIVSDEFTELQTVTTTSTNSFMFPAENGVHTYGVKARKTVGGRVFEGGIVYTNSVDIITEEESDFEFAVLNDIRCVITGYHGSDTSLTLPETGCYGRTVSEIASGAFSNRTDITEVTMPGRIQIIRSNAFSGCTALRSIELSNSLRIIETSAFENCGISDINLPATIQTLSEKAFYQCSALVNVNASACTNLKTIGAYAFAGCSVLQEVLLPDSVQTLQTRAFYQCISLEAFRFPQNLKSIGTGVFRECTALAEIHFPQKQLTIIGTNAFYKCTGITGTVVIPDTVTTINDEAFRECRNITGIILSSNLQNIGNQPFKYCSSLKNIVIPEGITEIPDACFNNCNALENVVIPSTVTRIGIDSFHSCDNLESVRLPAGIELIDNGAFAYCSKLKSINLPDSVALGTEVFLGCAALEEIRIPSTVTTIGALFSDSGLRTVVIPDSVTSLGAEAFRRCESLTSVVLPSTITAIDNYAFDHCSALETIVIPSSVTSIGKNAFYYCTSLRRVEIPASVSAFGADAFGKSRSDIIGFYGVPGSPAQDYVENTLSRSFYDISVPTLNSPSVTVESTYSSKITIQWNTTNGAVKYWAYIGDSSSTRFDFAGPFTTQRTYTWTDLEPGKKYYFWVTAVNANYQESSFGTPAHATTTAGSSSTAPGTPSPSFGSVDANSIELKWDQQENATTYNVFYSTSSTKPLLAALTVDASTLVKRITGLAAGTKYYFWVSALNLNGESVSSSVQKTTQSSGAKNLIISHGGDELYDYADGGTVFNINFGASSSPGDQYTLNIQGNQNWTVTSNSDWISIDENQQNGSGNGSVILEMNNNTGYQAMTGKITINVGGRTVTGNISKPEWAAGLSMKVYHKNASGSIDQQIYETKNDTPVYNNGITLGDSTGTANTYTFYVESNFDWTLSSSGNWFSIAPKQGTGGSEPTAIRMTFNSNINTAKQTGTITIVAGENQRSEVLNVVKPARVMPGPGITEGIQSSSSSAYDATIEWRLVDGADSYKVYYSTGTSQPSTHFKGTITEYPEGNYATTLIPNLKPDTMYYCWVAACTEDGGESIAGPKSFSTKPIPRRVEIIIDNNPVTEFTFNKNERVVWVYKRFYPENSAIVGQYSGWESDDPTIATVDSNNGLVMGLKAGQTKIRYKLNYGKPNQYVYGEVIIHVLDE